MKRVKDETPFRYAHAQIRTRILVICDPTRRRPNPRHFRHNDVIKPKPIPNVARDTLEAYFYQTYDDPNDGFLGYPDRPGEAGIDNTCDVIDSVPKILRQSEHMAPWGLQYFYQKYTEAYGIPVVERVRCQNIHVCVVLGSRKVSDEALKRACYVLRFLLADRQDLRHAFYSAHGRVAVIATGEQITLLPEYTFLGKEYDEATRGLGAVPMIPVASAGEENILCEEEDIYLSEDILIRELSISILRLAVSKALPGASNQLHNYYTHAKMSGWWRDTYAILTPDAYFGEGVQSFFDVNGFSHEPDGRHNHVSIRTRLRTYDSQLYNLVARIFPCANHYIKRCNTRGIRPPGEGSRANQMADKSYYSQVLRPIIVWPSYTGDESFITGHRRVAPRVGRTTALHSPSEHSSADIERDSELLKRSLSSKRDHVQLMINYETVDDVGVVMSRTPSEVKHGLLDSVLDTPRQETPVESKAQEGNRIGDRTNCGAPEFGDGTGFNTTLGLVKIGANANVIAGS
ncbi:hypothetical protein LSH36_995g01086 [Paralvinella palmiformis]|uniref:Uncharacterized protein n=1 Tax=Paralvinella palmiformis TaxID=53620 RepID=A0AAD9MS43_9ANNE|nr:hypothetical protein LSH36_995g01086 [Paralvinella palmiformis]